MSVIRATSQHIPAIMNIQSMCYPPDMNEHASIFHAMISASPFCYVAVDAAKNATGYMLAHGWKTIEHPPELHSFSEEAEAECIFIHDLAIHPGHRAQGLANRLVQTLMKDTDILGAHPLVAVNGSHGFWERHGFVTREPRGGKGMGLYGDGARYMIRSKM